MINLTDKVIQSTASKDRPALHNKSLVHRPYLVKRLSSYVARDLDLKEV